MIKLGEIQTLTAVRRTDNGFYLSDGSAQSVLLPNNEITESNNIGDSFDVFVYKDSQDRIIATTTTPYVTLGNFATLTVKEITPIGAFLDWGLLKDLLLPFREQKYEVHEGDNVFVSLYIDKSERLCATTKVYELLSCDSPYKRDDIVSGTVYEINPKLGAFVAIDNKYSALLPTNRIISPITPGDTISAYVTEVRQDGKLNLSLTEKSYQHMDEDAGFIMDELEENDGFLPYNDKSDADDIKKRFSMSKNSFKRAIGRLYKARKILIKDDGIYLNK